MTAAKRFTTINTGFVCGHCGAEVPPQTGSCRNHCNVCLYSRHVDVNPGDRMAECKGLMEPVCAEMKGDQIILYHKCTKCGFLRKNRTAPDDNFQRLLDIMKISDPSQYKF